MERPKLIGLLALCTMLGCGLFSAAHTKRVVAAEGELVRSERTSKTDLEVNGIGVRHGYIHYDDLLTLPQVTATVEGDENFTYMHTQSVKVTGVELGVLTKALHIPTEDDLLLARCLDGYVGPYPTKYVKDHQPILILTVDGMTISEWAKKTGNEDPGPYLISYESFTPAWHVLAHADRAQVPLQVLELDYKRQKDVFGPITPAPRFAPDSPERAGFEIAKQNCIRCHAAGPYGGTKAGLSWEVLSGLAKMDGTMFAKYIKDPKSVSPTAKMPAHPQYDAATLEALTSYFRSMAKE